MSQPIGHDKVPTFFWGPFSGTGVTKKEVASLRDDEDLCATQPAIVFFLYDLDSDGCLLADQLKAHAKTFESTGAENKKDFLLNWT